MKLKRTGFTVVEMMVVVAILGILAMIAIPSSLGRIVKEQINVAIPLAEIVKMPIAASWAATKVLPANNEEAGLPSPDKIVNNFIRAVDVEKGAIHITFGNKAHPQIKDKILTLRPAVIEDSQIVPVTWVCAGAKAPEKMVLKGEDKTNVPVEYLPHMCR